jgi:glycosyltransferase involved in cell wall biosynthesis
MASPPQISVVMPVYNGAQFLATALDSILSQTFTDFECLVINDGSTDDTGEILAHYQQRDVRIRVLQQPQNLGLVAALNRGCLEARGVYIARMDADDVSLPTRFARQVAYLEHHPEVDLCGTWIRYINEQGNETGHVWHPPTNAAVLAWALHFGSTVAHPSWLMRRRLPIEIGYYRSLQFEDYNFEDYDFLLRMSLKAKLGNVPEELLLYRYWSQSKTNREGQAKIPDPAVSLQEALNEHYGISISLQLTQEFRALTTGKRGGASSNIAHLLDKIYICFQTRYHMNDQDAHLVKQDYGLRLLSIGISMLRRHPLQGTNTVLRAILLNPLSALQLAQKAVKQIRERSKSIP